MFLTSALAAQPLPTFMGRKVTVKEAELDKDAFFPRGPASRGLGGLRVHLAHCGIPVRLDAKRGKGSHATLYFGTAMTVIQNLKRELPGGTVRPTLRQLGLSPRDLD